MLATHWPNQAQKHERTPSWKHLSIARLGDFAFFYINAKTYTSQDDDGPLVKSNGKGTREYHHGLFFFVVVIKPENPSFASRPGLEIIVWEYIHSGCVSLPAVLPKVHHRP